MVNVDVNFDYEDAQAAITFPDLEDATPILTLDELDHRLGAPRGDGAPTVN